jgi:hypothetical protein
MYIEQLLYLRITFNVSSVILNYYSSYSYSIFKILHVW